MDTILTAELPMYSVPRSVLDAFRQRPRPVLYYAGSFNPPHPGHLQAIKGAAQQLQEMGLLDPILVVAPKSDERLKQKMGKYGETLMFPWLERVKLFQQLWRDLNLEADLRDLGDLHFDSSWRHFRGEATQIRRDTDRAFGALGCQVFRVMGEDRVVDQGLEDDPMVLSTPRCELSSSHIRQLLVDDAFDALDALVGPKVAEAYMQSFATLWGWMGCHVHFMDGLPRAVHLVFRADHAKREGCPGRKMCDNIMQKGQSLVVMLSGIGLLHSGGLCGTSKPLATPKSTSLVRHWKKGWMSCFLDPSTIHEQFINNS